MNYWLGLGANLGDRLAALQDVLDELVRADVTVEAVSDVFETAPRDVTDQPSFLNAACRIDTPRTPRELLTVLSAIERAGGRVPGLRFGPRVIDVDVLVWDGGGWHDDRLEIPHPRLWERRFALVPLAQVAATDTDVGGGLTISEALARIDPAEQPVERFPAALRLP